MSRELRARATESVAVAAATVTDRTSAVVLGLDPRAFRDFVRDAHVPHAKIGRRVVARVDLVLQALDRLAGVTGAAEPYSESAVIELAARRGARPGR